jgi:hypothetical protein
MSSEQHWTLKALRFITKEEVKTPLSFLFKIVPLLVLGWLGILYAPIGDDLKGSLLHFITYAVMAFGAAVLLFAWFRPKHLVYGESGHRAEHKVEFGTEARSMSKDEVELLVSVSDPNQPLIEKK